jgi:hypothetical protein
MNYFAHACPFLDDPYFAAGTGVPDWLTVADRPARVRREAAVALARDADPRVAAVARGVVQHLSDDARFHETLAFAELSLRLTGLARDVLDGETGFRPSFLGHLLVEVLLDASLVARSPERLHAYYRTLDAVDASVVEQAVNRMAPRPTTRLAWMIRAFCRERILWDYLEDGRLGARLNQVMRRVGFGPLPERFREALAEARPLVDLRKAELLDGIPTPGLRAA